MTRARRWVLPGVGTGAVLAAAAVASALLLPAGPAWAQGAVGAAGVGSRGAVPAPVVTPAYFDAAVRRGSRTTTGKPGPSYWTNDASYDLRARLDPATARLGGEVDIRYVNRSPLPLRLLVLHLYQNLHLPGAPFLLASALLAAGVLIAYRVARP